MQTFEGLRQARDAVRRVPAMPASVELLELLNGLRRTVDAAYLDVLRRLVVADEWQADGSRSASAWLARLLNISKGQASAEVSVATKLSDLPETGAALADGDICFEHAHVINKLARELPDEHGPDLDKYLVEAASPATTQSRCGATPTTSAPNVCRSRPHSASSTSTNSATCT